MLKDIVLLSLSLIFLSSITGCQPSKSIPPAEIGGVDSENTDSSCAYFYYLWGAHAENSRRFDESLKAYQKALICDPEAKKIKSKIPLLLIKSGDKAGAIAHLSEQISNNPEDVEERLVLGNLYLQTQRHDEAITLFKEILEIEPDRQDIMLRMGLIYTQQQKVELAESIFFDLLEKNEDYYHAHLYLARLYLTTKQYESAMVHYASALRLNWSTDLIHEIATLYKITGEYDKLASLYDDFTQSNPYDERAQFGLVEALLQTGKEDVAVEKLGAMKAYVRNPYIVELVISKITISQGKLQEAITRLQSLVDSPVSSEAKFLLALLFAEVDQRRALGYLEEIKNDFSDFENAVYLKTKLFRALDRMDEAIAAVEQQLADEDNRRASFYSILSALHELQGDNQSALSAMEEGTQLYPDNGDLHFELSLLYEENGRREEAISVMERVLVLQPNNAEALNFIGYVWADDNINLEKALQYIEKAHALKPESGYIRDSLGWVHYRLGNLVLARSHLEAAAKMEENDPYILEHLGDVYSEMAEYTMAIETYLRALEGLYSEEEKARIQEKIDAITDQ